MKYVTIIILRCHYITRSIIFTGAHQTWAHMAAAYVPPDLSAATPAPDYVETLEFKRTFPKPIQLRENHGVQKNVSETHPTS